MLRWRPSIVGEGRWSKTDWFALYTIPVEVDFSIILPEQWGNSYYADPARVLPESFLRELQPWFKQNKVKAIYNSCKLLRVSTEDIASGRYNKVYHFKFRAGHDFYMEHLVDIHFKTEKDAAKFRKHLVFLRLKN
jgi:hypothetical protein